MSKYAKLLVAEEKPKSELAVWLERNHPTVKETRIDLHIGDIDLKDRESVASLGRPVTDLVRQQVDAIQDAVIDLEKVSSRFSELKLKISHVFETVLPPQRSILDRVLGRNVEVPSVQEVRDVFDDLMSSAKICVNDAKFLNKKFEHLIDGMPSITKQLDELAVCEEYLLGRVADDDWVNKRTIAINQTRGLHEAGINQLDTAKQTIESFIDSVNDLQNTMMPTWQSISIEIMLKRCSHQEVDAKLCNSLVEAAKQLKEQK
jgi:hypothetical protein